MVRDRLADLKMLKTAEESKDVVVVRFSDDGNDQIDVFFKEVQDIRESIERMQAKVEEVTRIHTSILLKPVTDEKMQHNLGDLMSDIKRSATRVRGQIKEMEKANDELGNLNQSSAEYRIRRTQQMMLSKHFVEVMSDYNMSQTQYRDKCKSRIQRQLEITGKSTTNEELEELLESGNIAIFTQGILADTQQARQTLADIQARHTEIVNLEKSIKELHDVFVDMAVLVEQQGGMIDHIEYNVTASVNYVEQGRKQATEALENQGKARTKKIWCYGIVLVVAIVLVALIILSLWP